jgi:hypothetical protein
MTHQAEQPNPAQPYMNMARDYMQGGLARVLRQRGVELPDWINKADAVLQNPDFNLAMGVMTPIKGAGVRMGAPLASDIKPAGNTLKTLGANINPDLQAIDKYGDALIFNKITPSEFEGFLNGLGVDQRHIPGIISETKRRGDELRQAVRDEIMGMRDEGVVRGPEERAQDARSQFRIVPKE